ncbi:30S ribosomal protein S12 methylthiotransferase RimO [Lachnoclostridium sp. Marseille-P6806]|uniref:30S ribosomal protein S12 methylthiotransferase RimO n=1 Tax=Lachnoclostridium sp. Marseille-P6806 TaxID=2364793 RepID=UPI0010306239|nr:30S ribosomal protein S12 methylthiotransferase RimO [Lachnoclostridium sp. Marseille-P6806]
MKIYFVSLGCDKNLVDAEKMLGSLAEHGHSFTDDVEAADIAVVNTCCFVKDAQMESVQVILEMAERRRAGSLSALIVAGCMAQRYRDEIRKEVPEVDAVIGTSAIDAIVRAAEDVTGDLSRDSTPGSGNSLSREALPAGTKSASERIYMQPLDRPEHGGQKRILTTGGHIGYLKIAEGCSKCCTYCAIPSFRGPYRSVPEEELLTEARALAAEGVKELILVAQETTVYGTDLYGEKRLPELLHALCRIEGFRWIRILYCYPEEITDELIETMASEPKIVHYLDMPVQHASDEVLRRMGRRTNRRELEDIIGRLRERIPDICLRTTLITGFPGETEQDHRRLLAFIRKMKFDRLGVFTYSKEDGTPAAKLRPQIPARVKKQRQKEIMLLQQEVAFRKARRMKGQIMDAMIEGRLADDGTVGKRADRWHEVYTARTGRDAPEVDGILFIETEPGKEFVTGDFVRVRITGSEGYDLIGEPAM